eukprot:CAMPEP_0182427640 /NCGR_PEP_ID=MMETSP1167-20130531/18939_1 /TAXON_ID=2988 /ORGANISM="Mallomonas Sp, Strain CCMP3275" /LENGTH=113 /DNA_ID=CAMNT_0024610021 /DNA_START=194 /DNA_END=535 /DNA_ORIENTATION=+
MTVVEFGRILKGDGRSLYQIVDVREPTELQAASIKGDDIINLPLSQAGEWSVKIVEGDILDANRPTLCLCHVGMRSMKMANFLVQQAGFKEVYNIDGGIQQYSEIVDPSVGAI